MKKTLLFSAAAVALLFATSCKQSQDSTYYQMYRESTPRFAMVKPLQVDSPAMVADLKVNETRISYQERFENELNESDIKNPKHSGLINYWKEYTVAKAVAHYNADVLLSTTFDITTSADYKYVTVEVRGYCANYQNFRKVEPKCPKTAACPKAAQAGCPKAGQPACCKEGQSTCPKAGGDCCKGKAQAPAAPAHHHGNVDAKRGADVAPVAPEVEGKKGLFKRKRK